MRQVTFVLLGAYIACAFIDVLMTVSMASMGLIVEGNVIPRAILSRAPGALFFLPAIESVVVMGVATLVKNDRIAVAAMAAVAAARVMVVIHNLIVAADVVGKVTGCVG